MSQEFRVVDLEAQPILTLSASVSTSEISSVLGGLYAEIRAVIRKKGTYSVGMPFSIYHFIQEDQVEIEAGMFVASPVSGEGHVKAGELPGGLAVTTAHYGPYENLPETYEALSEWMETRGYEPAGPFWEVYSIDPGKEPDPSKWRTDIFWPIK